MGRASSKFELKRDQSSPTNSEDKSILSRPLSKFCDFDTLWDCVIDVLTSTENAFVDQLKEGKIRDTQVTWMSDKDLIIRRLLDGTKFDTVLANELGLNRGLIVEDELQRLIIEDQVLLEKCRVDKEQGTIVIDKFTERPIKRMLNRTCIAVHREPVRFEYWIESIHARFNTEWLRGGCYREIDTIMQRALQGDDYMGVMYLIKRSKSEGLFSKWERSLSDPAWDAFVSEPLDDLVDFETLWKELVHIQLHPPWYPVHAVQQLSDSEYKIVCPKVMKPRPDGSQDWDLETILRKWVERVGKDIEAAAAREKGAEPDASKAIADTAEAGVPELKDVLGAAVGTGDEEETKGAAALASSEVAGDDAQKAAQETAKSVAEADGAKLTKEGDEVRAEEGTEAIVPAQPSTPLVEAPDIIENPWEKVMYLTVDEANNAFKMVKYNGWGYVKNTDYHKVHRNPLRVEVWSELPYHRRSGKLIQLSAQTFFDAVMDRVEAVGGLKAMMDQEFDSGEEEPEELEEDGEEQEHTRPR
mmetsp:Transcript_85034/g.275348  ORF Transcript_85034/g.275348 Transcript_85034/m.275348 type:complete len:528 (+) Transcript_85034:60-1643(+)